MSFGGGAQSVASVLALAIAMTDSGDVAPTAGGTLSVNSVSLGSYDYCIKNGNQTISAFTESDWFTSTADSRAAFVVINGNLTINAGQVFKPANRKLFTVIYVNGDLILNGEISMSARGANHSASGSNIAAGTILIATGTYGGVSNPEIPSAGSAGGAGQVSPPAVDGAHANGTAGSAGGTGGGGSGAASVATSGGGATGTSFSGGPGGGAGFGSGSGSAGGASGGSGGASTGGSAGAGAGNPSGGTGGTLIVFCVGYSGSGSMTAAGAAGASGGGSGVGGGGSGGGSVTLCYATDSGPTPTAAGGVGGTGFDASYAGGIGGAGTARKLSRPITLQTVSATQGQTATLARSKSFVKALTATQGQTATLLRSKTFKRTLSATQGQTATLTAAKIPTITGIVPSSDRTTGGSAVTILGSNFVVGAAVTFGGISATSIVVVSTSRITCIAPANAAGATTAVITNPDSSTASIAFMYYTPDADSTRLMVDFGGTTPLILEGSVSSSQNAASGSVQFEIVPSGSRPVPYTRARFGIGSLADRDLFFNGKVQTSTAFRKETNQCWSGVVTDSGAEFNRNLAWGTYNNIDAGLIALDLLAKYAPDFTGASIGTGLGLVSIIFNGGTMDAAFLALAASIGGYYYRDESYDVHLFLTETPSLVPDPIDSSNTSMLMSTFRWTANTQQSRNRVIGVGANTNVVVDAAIGASSLVVQNSLLFDNAANKVLIGSQKISYTGVTQQVPATPSLNLSASTPGNIASGVYYKYSYIIGGVESALSAAANISGGFFLPLYTATASYAAGSPGGGMGIGSSYHYCYSYYSLNGEGVNSNNSGDAATVGANGSINISSLTVGGSTGIGIRVWRTKAGGTTSDPHYYVGSTPPDNSTTTFADRTADVNLGDLMGTTGLGPPVGVAHRAVTVTVANGPAGTTSKNIYRTPDGAASANVPYYNVGSIADNVTTTFTEGAANSGLITVAPASSGLGFLTGIPTSGTGSILAAVPAGSTVNLYAEQDDLASQALVRAIEGGKSTGIYEFKLTSPNIAPTQTALNAACIANLALYSSSAGVITATGTSFDNKIHYGRTIHINKDGLVGDFLIQEVRISDIGTARGVLPRYSWTASSIRFSFEELMRRLTANLANP